MSQLQPPDIKITFSLKKNQKPKQQLDLDGAVLFNHAQT